MFDSLTSSRCKTKGSAAYATLKIVSRLCEPMAKNDLHADRHVFSQFELDEFLQILCYPIYCFLDLTSTVVDLRQATAPRSS